MSIRHSNQVLIIVPSFCPSRSSRKHSHQFDDIIQPILWHTLQLLHFGSTHGDRSLCIILGQCATAMIPENLQHSQESKFEFNTRNFAWQRQWHSNTNSSPHECALLTTEWSTSSASTPWTLMDCLHLNGQLFAHRPHCGTTNLQLVSCCIKMMVEIPLTLVHCNDEFQLPWMPQPLPLLHLIVNERWCCQMFQSQSVDRHLWSQFLQRWALRLQQ